MTNFSAILVAVSSLSLAFSLPQAAVASERHFTAQSQVSVQFIAIDASGSARAYQVGEARIEWAPGLPVVAGDKIEASISLVGGNDRLLGAQLSLDNSVVCSTTQAPWELTLPTDKVSVGLHKLVVSVQLLDRAKAFADQTYNIDIVSNLPAQFLAIIQAAPVQVAQPVESGR